jgi:hypothetical protein
MKLTIITVNDQDDYDSWKDAQSEFISFVPPGQRFTQEYFNQLLNVFSDRPLFRKLSMVSPTIEIKGESSVYGWLLSPTSIIPSRIKSSLEPYAIQIGYLPGAIIKKTALERLQPRFKLADLHNSIDLSLELWDSGLRCYIHPKVAIKGEHRHGLAISYKPEVREEVQKIWKRELVG